jgi:hypothetical protein
MISDLNFYPTNKGNYTMKEPSDSNFLAEIFSNYGQTNSHPNQVQNKISNFKKADIIRTVHMIVAFIHIHIHLFTVTI